MTGKYTVTLEGRKMSMNNLKRRAGIAEQRNAEGDAVLLAGNLLRMLKRNRALSESNTSLRLVTEGAKLKRQVIEREMGTDIYRMQELAGLFEDDDDDKDNGASNQSDYGYETDNSGNEKGSSPAVKTEIATLHADMMDCWSSLRKCIMDCTIDGTEVPSTMRTTIDKLGRTIEGMEELAGKV